VIGVQFFGLGLLGELLAHSAQSPEAAARSTPLREAIGLRGAGPERMRRD
jgi:hypothetical protein